MVLKKGFLPLPHDWLQTPKNGTELDSTSEIVDSCANSKEVEKYYETKKESIQNTHRTDSNSAAASGTSSAELTKWLDHKNSLLEKLYFQKDDVYDLGEFSDSQASIIGSDQDSDSDQDPGEDSPKVSNNDTSSKLSNNDTSSNVSNNDTSSNVSNNDTSSNSFTQDTTDIVQTDFDPSDYYEDQ